MTVIDASKGAQRITDPDQVRDYYRGAQDGPVKIGAEIEYAILCRDMFAVPSWEQTKHLYDSLRATSCLTGFEPPTSAPDVTFGCAS